MEEIKGMKYCQKCGARVKGEERICRNCGGPVEPDKVKTAEKSAESGMRVSSAKAEPEKSNKGLMIALIVILTAIMGVSGYLFAKNSGSTQDNADTNENDTHSINEDKTDSEKIKLEEVSEASELPYYDFVTKNCKDDGDEKWEDTEDLPDKGFQVNENDVKKPYVEFEVNFDIKLKEIKKEDFNETVQILKYRLNALETPYAIKYEKGKKSYKIRVKIGTDRMGTIATKLLAYNGDDASESSILKTSNKTLLKSVEDFSFKLSPDGKYIMKIAKSEISDSETEKVLELLKEHNGENMYWVCGGNAITELKIDHELITNFEQNKDFEFTELLFFDGGKKEDLYPILKLMYVALKGEQYPIKLEISNNDTVEFSDDADDTVLGYRTISKIDKDIADMVSSLNKESSCYRPLILPDSGTVFNIDLVYDEGKFDEVEFLKTVKKIYEKTKGFYGGYHTVKISALTKSESKGIKQKVIELKFTKDSDGFYEMSCVKSGKSDEFKDFLKEDSLFSELTKDN